MCDTKVLISDATFGDFTVSCSDPIMFTFNCDHCNVDVHECKRHSIMNICKSCGDLACGDCVKVRCSK